MISYAGSKVVRLHCSHRAMNKINWGRFRVGCSTTQLWVIRDELGHATGFLLVTRLLHSKTQHKISNLQTEKNVYMNATWIYKFGRVSDSFGKY